MATYYEILDVPCTATPDEIKSAYRILVQLHHPDRLQQANSQVRQYAEERLKKINEAYAVLSDPARRQRYDATRRDCEPEPDSSGQGRSQRKRRPSRSSAGRSKRRRPSAMRPNSARGAKPKSNSRACAQRAIT